MEGGVCSDEQRARYDEERIICCLGLGWLSH